MSDPWRRWHSVLVSRRLREGRLLLDGEEVRGSSPGHTRGLNVRTPLYLGGLNTTGFTPPTEAGEVGKFHGCIVDLEVSGRKVDMLGEAVDSANIAQCQLSSPCDRRPCHNQGVCAEDGNGGFSCSCPEGHSGGRCEAGGSLCQASPPPCLNGGVCSGNSSHFSCYCPWGYSGTHCNITVNMLNSVGMTGDSHLELRGAVLPRNSKEETLEIVFSTLEEDGLLLWKGEGESGGLGTSDDYLVISLVGGHPHVEYELGGGPLSVSLGQKVNDDLHHSLSVLRAGRLLSVSLDGHHQHNRTSSGSYQVFNTEGNIFIGGSGPRHLSELTHGKCNRTFVGCVHSLVINNTPTDFSDHVRASNLVPCHE